MMGSAETNLAFSRFTEFFPFTRCCYSVIYAVSYEMNKRIMQSFNNCFIKLGFTAFNHKINLFAKPA